MFYYSNYITVAAGDIQNLIDKTIRALRPHSSEFDAIAFRGLSGALVAPAAAAALGKNLLCVRKELTGHSSRLVEGICHDAYVIVDDFVATGETLIAIAKAIDTAAVEDQAGPIKCYGHFVYKHTNLSYSPDEKYREDWHMLGRRIWGALGD